MSQDNPFDELELDPTASAERITDALRERAERASPEARERIRSLWRQLTLNDDERVRLALRAHPRRSELADRTSEELADRIPPRLGRLDAPELRATVADVLLTEDDSQSVPDECGPPNAFEQINNIDAP